MTGTSHEEDGGLSRYDRVTVGLWARSHAQLTGLVPSGVWERCAGGEAEQPAVPVCIRQAAAHAVLVALRECAGPRALLDRFETCADADFALIESLLPSVPPRPPVPRTPAPPAMLGTPGDSLWGDAGDVTRGARGTRDERRFQVREAAFHLRWIELGVGDVCGGSPCRRDGA